MQLCLPHSYKWIKDGLKDLFIYLFFSLFMKCQSGGIKYSNVAPTFEIYAHSDMKISH